MPMEGDEDQFWIDETKKIEKSRKNHVDFWAETVDSKPTN
jgi:hypothetical protein